jgi:hypothetical protein
MGCYKADASVCVHCSTNAGAGNRSKTVRGRRNDALCDSWGYGSKGLGVWVGVLVWGLSKSLLDVIIIQYTFMNNCCFIASHVILFYCVTYLGLLYR